MAKINLPMIRKVLKHIKDDLRRLDMKSWGIKKGAPILTDFDVTNGKNWAACNTKACMAGWTVLLNTPKSKWNTLFRKDGYMKGFVRGRARKLLGLDELDASAIFAGNSLDFTTASSQYKALKTDINDVLIANGLEERV